MNIALWIIASLLALVVLASGVTKWVRSRDDLVAVYPWVEDFSRGWIRSFGAVEILGAVGLVVPPAVGVLSVLSPAAATGLGAFMAGPVVVHLRRGGATSIARPLVLLVLATALAVLRFGPFAF